jgi:Cdc6-like AAA superfamily ATPase
VKNVPGQHAYSEFSFKHPSRILVVGPSGCGKTYLVSKILEKSLISFADDKPLAIEWYYSQWQEEYYLMEEFGVKFTEGLPQFDNSLSDLSKKNNTVIVLDDLMSLAQDSMLVSRLFTQGRHRNATVIMMLQNAFPKGKYNTEISRNASHTVLFRSNADRRQMNSISNRIFSSNSPQFMGVYAQVTKTPRSYVLIDNSDETSSEKQIVLDILGDSKYANIYEGVSTELSMIQSNDL